MKLEISPGKTPEEIEAVARRAAAVLEEDGLLVYPTETVYGIGGSGSRASDELIARVKRRESGQPFIMLTPDLESLQRCLGIEWTADANTLARHFWPGPLTLVVRRASAGSDELPHEARVAVRISPHPIVEAIFRHRRCPITSTSANLAGAKPARTLWEALELFGGRPDLEAIDVSVSAIDGGPTPGGIPSTVVSCTESPPHILREGLIGAEAVRLALKQRT